MKIAVLGRKLTKENVNLGEDLFLVFREQLNMCGKNEEIRAKNCGESVFPFILGKT